MVTLVRTISEITQPSGLVGAELENDCGDAP
jgi:hypothetical protein